MFTSLHLTKSQEEVVDSLQGKLAPLFCANAH